MAAFKLPPLDHVPAVGGNVVVVVELELAVDDVVLELDVELELVVELDEDGNALLDIRIVPRVCQKPKLPGLKTMFNSINKTQQTPTIIVFSILFSKLISLFTSH